MEIISTHLNTDFDALASMVAASKLYPQAKLVFAGAIADNVRFFLEKFSREIQYLKLRQIDVSQITKIILVDTNTGGHLGKLNEIFENPALSIHIYDHHPPSPSPKIKPDKEIIRYAGATTTIMVSLLRENKIEISPLEATLMALGIYEDTGFLTFKTTKPEDLYAVAWLMEKGADLTSMTDFIKKELSAEQISLLNELVQTTEIFQIHNVQVMISTASIEKYIPDVAILAHKLRDIEQADTLFVLVQMEGSIHLIARSRVLEVNAGELLRHLGGGGHSTAASANIRDLTLIQVKEKLLGLLEEHIPPVKLAAQIMTSPALCVNISTLLQEAKNIFLRHNINNIPATDSSGELKGILSRQIVDKALAHGLSNSNVANLMNTEIQTVTPNDELDTIKLRMMERHQQFLPVVNKKNHVVGVITRTDLLHVLHEKMASLSPQKESLLYPHKKNLKSLIRERLPRPIQDILHLAGEIGDELGFGVYAVGGMVRDMLLRKDNLDIDLVVEHDGISYARHMADKVGGHFRAHEKFGTAVVVFPGGFKLDVATARTEYYNYPAALPIVEQSSIKMDLYRRDFTINALAIKLNSKEYGSLIDYFGGQQDLKNGIIRVLHSLSLVEDPTRVFRAIRFEQRFGFKLGKQTQRLMQDAIKSELCAYLESSRLFNELCLIFQETDPYKSISQMNEFGLMKCIHPKLTLNQERINLFQELQTVINWYNLLFLKEKIDRWFLFLLGFSMFLTGEESGELSNRMALSEKHAKLLLKSHEEIPALLNKLQRRREFTPSQIYDLLSGVSLESLLMAMAKTGSAEAKQHISLYLTKLQHKKTLITGADLINLGLSPGPLFGRIKQEILYARLDGKLKSKEEELDWVKKNMPYFLHSRYEDK